MTFWQGKSVLVAGGAGLIGSHLARALLKNGAEVCIADNLSSGSLRNIKDIQHKGGVQIVDLREKDNCKRLTKDKNYVFQIAANMGGYGGIRNDER
jgi:nucleoside-diphosphate-sugar epimerase